MRKHALLGLLLCSLVWSEVGRARSAEPGPLEILVCYPGGPVKAGQAEPAMDNMIKVLQSLGGWPAGILKHEFTSQVDECRRLLAGHQPAFAILSLGQFLQLHKKHRLVPLVRPRIEGRMSERYYLMVHGGRYETLGDLRGKILAGTPLLEPEFLKRVVFENKIDPATHFKMQPSRRPLRALRQLARDQVDAVLLTGQQHDSLKALPFAGQLKSVFVSSEMPLVGVVADAGRTSKEQRARMARALTTMCAHAEGKQMCELFGLEAFVPVDLADYAAVIKLWGDAS